MHIYVRIHDLDGRVDHLSRLRWRLSVVDRILRTGGGRSGPPASAQVCFEEGVNELDGGADRGIAHRISHRGPGEAQLIVDAADDISAVYCNNIEPVWNVYLQFSVFS